ncbi:MAG TPA: fimbrial assembly protein, partial [Terracidiphilus sp.]
MKVRINLATRPFADLGPTLKHLRIAMAVFAVVSIGLGVGIHLLHSKAELARARERTLDGQIATINQERQGYHAMMRQPDNAQVLDEANNLNALFDQKTFSWTLAMEDLETVLPGGVQVTALEPNREEKTGRITLKLRVVGPHDKDLLLVGNLEHSRHFLRPAIVGESSENSGGPGQPLEPVSASNKVNFDLTAEYNPATLGEERTTTKPEDSKK